MHKRFTLIFSLLCLMSINLLNAQASKWELSGFLGVSQYQGDLNSSSLKELNAGFGAVIRHHFNSQFALRGNLLFGKLTGDDANVDAHKLRGFTYSSPMTELSLMGEFDFLGKKRYDSDGVFSKKVSPYIFAGVGVLMGVKPTVNYNEAKNTGLATKIKEDKATTAKSTFPAIPLGLGLRFDINETWSINAEVGKRYTFNDYVDKVSASGNPDKNDTYLMGGVTVNYRFGSSKKKATMPMAVTEPAIKTVPMNGEIRKPTDLKTEELRVLESAIYGVQFETGKFAFKQESYAILDQIVTIMDAHPTYRLFISGHTDNTGNMASNQTLSEKRAEACFLYLISKKIDASRMVHRGFGQTKPIADNSTPEGRLKNRRVDFELSTQ